MIASAKEILSITKPEKLFSEPKKVIHEYRELAKQWHPDTCKDAQAIDVFTHIERLYTEAKRRVNGGHWGFQEILDIGSGPFFEILRCDKFEMGEVFIAKNALIYRLSDKYQSRRSQFTDALEALNYADARMERDAKRYFPAKVDKPQHKWVVVHKDKNLLCLRDVLNYYGGEIPPKQTAWIISTLYNLLCYFQWVKIAHNDISPDTYFINPHDHSGALLGGWWWATRLGSPLRQVPRRTFDNLPFRVRNTKKSSRLVDAELVLLTARELLGDVDLPAPMVKWITTPASKDSIENYRKWYEVLEESFGPRRFTEMRLTHGDIY